MNHTEWITLGIYVSAQLIATVKFFYRLEKRLDKIEYQLYENGGQSMKDQMNRTREDLNLIKTDIAVLKATNED